MDGSVVGARAWNGQRRRHAVIAAVIAAIVAVAMALAVVPADAGWAAPVVAGKPSKPGGGGGGGGGGSQEPAYIALGDSFAAGVGADSYLDTSCYRSSKSYPKLLDADADKRLVAFLACSGANTSAVVTQSAGMPSGAALVTVTVGGNDVGFADVMQNCFVLVTSTCAAKIATASSIATSDAFAANVAAVIAAIRSKAPTARIVVTGYPQLFWEDPNTHANPKYAWADEVNAQTLVLNAAIKRVAEANGATFADVVTQFAGHGIGSSQPWINDWSWFRTTNGFHPNAAGYVAYAGAIRGVISGG
ncbi:SGNH/GDSL hydrolase family protein [Microbacterium sp. E-13]|uniref:SGNH/GDSL hydrolase family protein n=1 Tax=Microbacterium sp. E-13 TaxID=3404048 RepID=UPI003CE6CB10